MPASEEHKARVLAFQQRQERQPAVIQATFSEWRMVKGRKVLVLCFEVPLEAQPLVMSALGTPMPDAETWVAIARLHPDAVQVTDTPAIEPPGRSGSLARQAGIICNEGAFNAWAQEYGHEDGKAYIYSRCLVTSRADLDKDEAAGQRFREMKADYLLWREGVTA